MNNNYKKAFSEVYEILSLVNCDLISKIPIKLLNFIELEKDNSYVPNFITSIPLEEQNLMKETIMILAIIKLNYWCSEEEKKEFTNMLNENEKIYQEKMNEKYKLDNIFKKSIKKDIVEEKKILNSQVAIEKYKESIFNKIVNKVKCIFHVN